MKRKFDVKLRKVGNSYVVTIPKDTVDRFDLNEGDYLALSFDSTEIKSNNTNKKESKEVNNKEPNEKDS